MKKFFILALFASVLAVPVSAQVSHLSWSKRYTSDMDMYAYVSVTNETAKTIRTLVFTLTLSDVNDRMDVEIVSDCKILPVMTGHVSITLTPHEYFNSDRAAQTNFKIRLKTIRYADGTVKNVDLSVRQE